MLIFRTVSYFFLYRNSCSIFLKNMATCTKCNAGGGSGVPWQNKVDNVPTSQKYEVTNADSRLDWMCGLNTEIEVPSTARLTGIICTMGPNSSTPEKVEKMIETGMNIARLNFSHGSYESHGKMVGDIRTAAANYGRRLGRVFPLALALDTKGPEIRTGLFKDGVKEVELKDGATIIVKTDKQYFKMGDVNTIYMDYTNITNIVKPGDTIYIDDGILSLTVDNVESADTMRCKVANGGMLGGQKGVNLPGLPVDLPTLSEKDISDLKFGVEQDVDMVFASFVRSAQAVHDIRKVLGEKGKSILVIPKIENLQGVQNIDGIIEAADCIMIARGDMGIEIPQEKVFVAQKMIIGKCNRVGKPVIVATMMLNSMMDNPRPTRAEVTDVGNAVLDGADCTMLSGESAKGKFPLESIEHMARINREAEATVWHKHLFNDLRWNASTPCDTTIAVAIAAVEASLKANAAAIIVLTTSGRSAKALSQFRPRCPVVAITRHGQVARQLQVWRCVYPIQFINPPLPNWLEDVDVRLQDGISYGKTLGFIKQGDAMVLVNGWRQGCGFTNTIRVVYASASP